MLLFLLCGNAGKHTGNADDIGYEDGVCVGRIGGKRTELWNPIPGIPLLFRYFLSGRATIAKGSGNVPLSKFVHIACGYAKNREAYENERYVLTEETAIRCENGRLSAFLFVFRFRRYTRMNTGGNIEK